MSGNKSFPPVYTELAQEASENLRQALPLINKYKTPVNPVNYAVWYEYVSGKNQALRDEIDQRLSCNAPITSQITQALFEKYVLFDMPERLENANNGIKLVVDNTINNLNKAESTTSECAAELNDTQSILNECSDIDTLKTIVNSILANTQTLTNSSNDLKLELEQSSIEMARLKAELEQVKEIAKIDGLTGLLNRGAFDKELHTLCSESGDRVSLALFDLDHFKRINDTFGHIVGDRVIQFFASLLKKYSANEHIAARYGGEEMVLILIDLTQQQAIELVDSIRSDLANSNLKQKNSDKSIGQITVSAGLSFFQLGDTPSSLIDRADRALYKAKNNGRNQVKIN
ncbi:MAG: GGDEF domain-containing protein [Gammaproteobacteria bacterium]|nr:GGDEF domain-containing protein [Gammaproteobacteria bacterium]